MSFVSCRVRSRFFPCAPTDERCLVQTLEHFDAGVRDDHPDATLLVSPYDSQKRDQYSRGSNLRGGTNGDRLREIDVVALPLIPQLYPDCLLRGRRRSGVGHYATVVKEPRIPRAQWAELAARAEREGLRRVARDFGVSHETVRSICTRVRQEAAVPEAVTATLARPHHG
jgi:hypothetical protein